VKIDGTIKADGVRVQSTTTQPAKMPLPRTGVAEPAGSQVEISRSASRLQQMGEAFDADRVAEIRQAIAEGRFTINPERIADGLIESVKDMLSHEQSPQA
jgi:negative regulator of flagellin synthesis FlgM